MSRPPQLSPLDRVFLDLDTAQTPQQVGWIIFFEGSPPSLSQLRAHIGSRLELVPHFRCRIERPLRRLRNAVWVADAGFAIERHVLAATAEAGDIAGLAARLLAQRLSPHQPLWQMWLVDGIEEGWAIAGHAHHSLVDGVAASQIAQLLLDAVDGSRPAAPRAPSRRPRRRARRLLRAARMMALRGPGTAIDGPASSGRAIGLARLDQPSVRAAARAHGATTNDALMAASAIALGKLLRQRGPAPRRIKALMPFQLRNDVTGRAAGNAISTVSVELPLNEADPPALLRTVATRTRAGKELGNAGAMAILARGASLIPAPARPGLTRLVYRLMRFNVIISSIPGPPTAVELLGRRATAFHPFVPITERQGISIGAMSYAGTICIGVNANSAAVPEAGAVAAAIARTLAGFSAGRTGKPGR